MLSVTTPKLGGCTSRAVQHCLLNACGENLKKASLFQQVKITANSSAFQHHLTVLRCWKTYLRFLFQPSMSVKAPLIFHYISANTSALKLFQTPEAMSHGQRHIQYLAPYSQLQAANLMLTKRHNPARNPASFGS